MYEIVLVSCVNEMSEMYEYECMYEIWPICREHLHF